jgi:hypothetical protein
MATIQERRKDFLAHYQFYEPVERLFYKALRAAYPEMTVAEIVVCRAIYIDHVISGGEYRHIAERMTVWSTYTIPGEEWARYVLAVDPKYKCETLEDAEVLVQRNIEKRGLYEIERFTLFKTEESIEDVIYQAGVNGYISFEFEESNRPPPNKIVLRDDIFNLLEKTTNEAVQTTEYVDDRLVLEQESKDAELDRKYREEMDDPNSDFNKWAKADYERTMMREANDDRRNTE